MASAINPLSTMLDRTTYYGRGGGGGNDDKGENKLGLVGVHR